MDEMDEKDLKVEIDQIMERVQSIMEKIEDRFPTREVSSSAEKNE